MKFLKLLLFFVGFLLFTSQAQAQADVDLRELREGATIVQVNGNFPSASGDGVFVASGCLSGGGCGGPSITLVPPTTLVFYINGTPVNIDSLYWANCTSYTGGPDIVRFLLPSGVFIQAGDSTYLEYTCSGTTYISDTTIVDSVGFNLYMNYTACNDSALVSPSFKERIISQDNCNPGEQFELFYNNTPFVIGGGVGNTNSAYFTSNASGLYTCSTPVSVGNGSAVESNSLYSFGTPYSVKKVVRTNSYNTLRVGYVAITFVDPVSDPNRRYRISNDLTGQIDSVLLSFPQGNVGDTMEVISYADRYEIYISTTAPTRTLVYTAIKRFTLSSSIGTFTPSVVSPLDTSVWNFSGASEGTYSVVAELGILPFGDFLSITLPSSKPTALSAPPVCPSVSTSLSGNCSSGTLRWYNNSSGTGLPLFGGASNPSYSNATPGNYRFYAFCESAGGCLSEPDSLDVVVAATPAPPTGLSASPNTGCSPSYSTTLSGSCATGTLRWYTSSGGTGAGISSTQTVTANTTYYAKCEVLGNPAGCQYSSSSSVGVTISSPPSAPTGLSASPNTGCSPSYSTTLSGSCATGTLRWYTSSGGTGAGISSTQTVTANTTYYAKCEVLGNPAGCQYSSASSVGVTISNPPSAPTGLSASPNTGCSPSYSTTLSGSCATGTLRWYTSSGATGAGISSTQTVTANTTYYAKCEVLGNPAGCQYSSASSVGVTISNPPSAPTGLSASPNTGCSPSYSTTLSGSCATGTLRWYTSSGATGAGISSTQTVTANTTYYAKCEVLGNPAGCQYSSASSVGVTISNPPSAPTGLSASPNTGCSPSYSTTLSGSCATGTLRWYTSSGATGAGISSTQTVTANTTYYAKCEVLGNPAGCQYSSASSVGVTISNSPSAPTGLSASPNTGCSPSYSTTLSGSCATGTLRWYTSSGATGAGISSTQTVTANTTYYAKCEVLGNPVGCQYSSASSVGVTISSPPSAPTGVSASPNTGCSPSYSTTLSGSCATGTLRWYTSSGATGAGISSTQTVTANTTYYAKCEVLGNPAGCQYSSASSVGVTISNPPSAPTGLSASPNTGCSPSYSTTLSGSCATGTLRWYTSSGATGAGISSTQTVTANTTYYAKCEVLGNPAGCQYSSASSVGVTISSLPSPPTSATASPDTICPSGSSNLSSTGCAGTVTWFTNSGGTGAPLGSTLVSPLSTTTYYAFCTVGSCRSSSGTSVTVTVGDFQNPVINCKDTTIYLNAGGSFTIDSSYLDNGSTDNCGISTMSISQSVFNCGNVGANSVTLTVTDVNGNSSSCNSTVMVMDTTRPLANCKDTTIYLNAGGSFTIDSSYINNGSTDNCGISAMSISQSVFNCGNVGANSVTLTVTDVNGNSSNCTSTVMAMDTTRPLANCKDTTIYLNAGGSFTIDSSYVNNGSTDNCGISTMSISQSVFNCGNVGANTVTLAVTDVNGNSSNCTSTVMVMDTTRPLANCKDTTIYLNAGGSFTIDSSYVNNGSTDNCGISTMSISQSVFNCGNVGANTVTLTVTDVNGNSSNCTSTVMVMDTTRPLANCKDTTIYLNAGGSFTIDSSYVNNGSTDNCGISTMSISQSVFNCGNVGANSVTLTVTDVNGNSSNCTSTVMVMDTTRPLANCKDTTIYLNAGGSFTIDSSYVNNGSTDNCGISTMSISQSVFNCGNVGANTVTLTVTDVNGNSSTCTSTVMVMDTTRPLANCKDTTIYLNGGGSFTIDSSYVNNGSTDNCGISTMSISQTVFNCGNVGANTVTLTVTDVNGNSSTCTSTVMIMDTTRPLANCKDTTIYLNAGGSFTIDSSYVDNGSTDNCGISTMSISQSVFNCGNVGANTVTLTVTDVNGNSSSCTSTVTVLDAINPNAIGKDTTIYLDALGNYVIDSSYINNGSTDNCAIQSMALSQTNFNCSHIGVNSVSLTVTDVNGNSSTVDVFVYVYDTINPNPLCKDTTIYLNVGGSFTIDSSYIDNGSNDNCGVATINLSKYNFTCADVGVNSVILTVTDVNGNIDSCTANVYVYDTIKPTPLCKDTTVYLNTLGSYAIDSSYINNGSYDNCAIATISVYPYSFNCSNVGLNPVTLIVTDVNGNIDSCFANVTVIDTINPIPLCKDTTIYLNAGGSFTIDSSFVDNGSNDACGVSTITVSQTSFDCSYVGINPVTLTVTDVNGNIDSCFANVIVIDTVKPTPICKDTTIYLNAGGVFTIDSSFIDNGSNDACGISTITVSQTSFDCSYVGINPITLTVTDVNGNVDSCFANVIVIDTINPIAVCKDTVVYLDAFGNFIIDSSYIDNGSYDNCGISTIGVSQTNFTCGNLGTNSVVLTVTDVNGNISTCNANVTVVDTINPTVVCQNITIQLDANGLASIVASDIDAGSTDNCFINSLNASITNFDCNDIGANNVTLTVVDQSGNSSSCNAIVTVVDNIPPTILCPITQYDTLVDDCTFIVPDLTSMAITGDNCDYVSSVVVTQNPLAGTVIDVSSSNPFSSQTINIELTATDGQSNSTSCYFDFEVSCLKDLVIPQFISPNGDGKNDTWQIDFIHWYPNNEIKVFNRYGSLVYTMKNYNNTWGGFCNVGSVFHLEGSFGTLPTGTYYYIIDRGNGTKPYLGYLYLNK